MSKKIEGEVDKIMVIIITMIFFLPNNPYKHDIIKIKRTKDMKEEGYC
jgi:hypothetical protein